MILLRMQISGFLSYQEKVDIDFSEFDLACISGANGAGKSSLLEAITWVLFGEARRRDDAIINHQSHTAEVILDFLYENVVYQVQRVKTKDKATLLEFRIRTAEGTWKPLTEATLRATEELIRNSLHLDYETFVNSAFFLQGKADQFAQQKPGDRKRILSGILGLDIWEEYKEEAARRRRELEGDVNRIDAVLAEIEEELKQEGERKARLTVLEKDLKVKKSLFEARKTLLDQQRLITDRVKNESRQLEKQSSEIQRLRNDLDSSIDDLQLRLKEQSDYQLQVQAEGLVREAVYQWDEARIALADWERIAANFHQYEAKRQAPLLKIEGERARLQSELEGLQSKQAEMQSLEAELPELTKQYEDDAERIGVLSEQLANRSTIEAEMREIQDEKSRARAENTQLTAEGNDLKDQIARIQESVGAACPTCEKPLSPEEREKLMLDLNDRLLRMREKYSNNTSSIETSDQRYKEKETALLNLQRVEAELKLQQRLFDTKTSELTRSKKELEIWKSGSALRLIELEEIMQIKKYALKERADLDKIDTDLKQLGYDPAAHEVVRQMELSGRNSQDKLVQLEAAKAALIPLEREIKTLEDTIDKDEKHLARLNEEFREAEAKFKADTAGLPDLSQLETEYYQAQEEMNQTANDLGYTRNQVEVLDRQREQKAARQEEKLALTGKIANLKILERAFGKDGIPALLIEQALPEIQEHANEILDRLSAGGMSIQFETQREFKDKKRDDRRETLDILIRDAAGERAYELFSGGEAFRINFAIRMALSQVLARRAGARLQTLVIDEGFGSQDAEGLQRLIEAINLSRSDFAKVLVISHLEEMKDAFSARIEVTKTSSGSRVQVVAA